MKLPIEIPKKIHFVWAGGSTLLPPESRQVIHEWSKGNSGFTIHIWIDSKTAERSFENIEKEYQAMFQSIGVDVISSKNIEDYKGKNAPIVIQDITEALREYPVSFEIEQLRPNYGASSDILRYQILYLHGGAYFDSDVNPNSEQRLIDTQLFSDYMHHTLFLDHASQKENPSKELLQQFSLRFLGNDTFICTKNNPLMKKILLQAKAKYYCTHETPNKIRYAIAHLSRDMRELTIGRTGPAHVTGVIGSCKPILNGENVELMVDEEKMIISRVRNGKKLDEGGLELTKPLPNTRNWLKIRVLDCQNSKEKAYKLTLDTIREEAENTGILRLDDHILYLSKSLNQEPSIVADELIARLKCTSLLRKKDLFIQLTFEHTQTEELYYALARSTGSTCKCLMNVQADETINIVNMQTACSSLKNQMFDSLTYLSNNRETDQQLTLQQIFSAQHEDVLERMSSQICEGSTFIERLLNRIEQFPIDTQVSICDALWNKTTKFDNSPACVRSLGILQLYIQYCNTLTNVDKAKIKPSLETMKELLRKVIAIRARIDQNKSELQEEKSTKQSEAKDTVSDTSKKM